MINPSAVFEIKPQYKPKPVLIRIRATQERIKARPCSNGWWYGANNFVHKSAADLIKVLKEES